MSLPRPGRRRRGDFHDLYDAWRIPASEEDGAPQVTALHDGADWVQVHAPRAFFERLAAALEAGELDEVRKWLAVWSSDRKERNPRLCGKPTLMGHPCHYDAPCRVHREDRRVPPPRPHGGNGRA